MSPRTIFNLSPLPSSKSACSDRFILCQSSSWLHIFGLFEKASPEKEGGNDAYSRLLTSELFGFDFWSFSCVASQ
ncbi:FIZZY-related 3 [Actinidia rufa]|uniref:FIZZY-related 3 n=1 Tax=Actinidia rufa TaxID=165716 RepID=A0A7J0EFL8_9ERIC|nr:FIZZY-related 3 [Actinidia rufa]